jgi:hypothetical protein
LTVGIAINAVRRALMASLLLENGLLAAIESASQGLWALSTAFALGGFVIAHSFRYGLLRRYRVDLVMPFTLPMLVGGAVILVGLSLAIRSPAPVSALRRAA